MATDVPEALDNVQEQVKRLQDLIHGLQTQLLEESEDSDRPPAHRSNIRSAAYEEGVRLN